MINWPDSPTPGQVFNPGTGPIYTWDGVAWNLTPVKVATARTRNRVNNPTAQVSQELGSTATAVGGAYPADQWCASFNGILSSAARWALGVASPEGSVTACGLQATTAKASLAAGDYLSYFLPIEGLDVADFLWGTAAAKPAVLRFSAICSTAGTYGFSIVNGANDRSFVGSFTLAAADVWQTFSFAIPGDVTGTWAKDATLGANVRFAYAAGSNFIGVAGWQAGTKLGLAGMSNGAAVINKLLLITDVGLHLDIDNTGIAPPFNAPSYEDDLARCMRYWTYTPVSAQAPVAGYSISSWYTQVPMRVAPTLAVKQAGASNVATIGQDTVSNERGGLFQISASANGGYVIGRLYGLSARMI